LLTSHSWPTHTSRAWKVVGPIRPPLVYDELLRSTARRMFPEAPGQTLQARALVPGAWLRLIGDDPDLPLPHWRGIIKLWSRGAGGLGAV